MKSERKLARIVPPAADDVGQLVRTQGTRVFVGGQEISGITRIELVCEVNDVWRARIDMMVQPPADLTAEAFFHRPNIWQRLWRWIREQAMRPATGFGPG